jgi:hypothetical protein
LLNLAIFLICSGLAPLEIATKNDIFMQDQRVFAPPMQGKPKDTTGAGSRFMRDWIKEKPLPSMIARQ